jgi:hypothetical protein
MSLRMFDRDHELNRKGLMEAIRTAETPKRRDDRGPCTGGKVQQC